MTNRTDQLIHLTFELLRMSRDQTIPSVYDVPAAPAELPAVAEGESRDQLLSVSLVGTGPPQHLLPHRAADPGPHWQQGARLPDRSVGFSTSVGDFGDQ